MKDLVSIIVPVYNVEKYLNRCIDSLLVQTYENIEILLINDGSTDSSANICEDYSLRDNRIKVIHRKNGGLSEARNTGILNSKGEYVLFVDSDDYINSDAVDICAASGVLIGIAVKYNLDVLEGNAIIKYPETEVKLTQTEICPDIIYSGLDYMVNRISESYLTAAAVTKFCKLQFLKDNNLYFLKDRLHEDELWTPRLYIAATRVMFVDFEFYQYCIRENSITQMENKEENIISMLRNCNELERIYNNLTIDRNKKNILKDYLARQYMSTAILGEKNLRFYQSNIDKKFILRNTKSLKTSVKSLLFLISITLYLKVRGELQP